MADPRLLIATVRNEGPFLLEWLAYHKAIGFDQFLLFSAPGEDGTQDMLDALQEDGVVIHEKVDIPDDLETGYRMHAMTKAMDYDAVRGADWAMVLDVDEFLAIRVGDGTLDALFEKVGQVDLISFMWRSFGNSGVVTFEDKLVTEQFIEAEPAEIQLSQQPQGIKTLFRPDVAARVGPHRPVLLDDYRKREADIAWIGGSGTSCSELFLEAGWGAVPTANWRSLGEINHYRLRSNEVFLLQSLVGKLPGSDTQLVRNATYAQVNTNHQEVKNIARFEKKVRQGVRKLKKNPAVDAAHRNSVAVFQQKIAEMRAEIEVGGLAQADLDNFLSKERTEETRRSQHQWLAARLGPPPVQDHTADPARTNMAPRWLADFRRSKFNRGFFISDDHFALQFTDRESDTLIVSFDNLSNTLDPSLSREAWGYAFYRDQGWSNLGVMAFRKDWYRNPRLFDRLEGLSAQGFFDGFDKVIFSGTSMGAYAATAFCDLAPGSRVLAFSPQSTLDKKIVPWETRFGSGRKRDWSGPYADAAQCGSKADHLYIIYDPYYELDRLHAERYTGDNVTLLKIWYSSHKSAQFLRRANLLKALTRETIAGTMTEERFYKISRSRRDLIWYLNGLANHALDAGHAELGLRLARHVRKEGHYRLADYIGNRAKEILDEKQGVKTKKKAV